MPRATPQFIVRRQPESVARTWGVFDRGGRLIEGGFFSRDAAEDCRIDTAREWEHYAASQNDTPSLADPMASER